VQGAELLEDEEQEDDHGPFGVFEVLQPMPQAHVAQGNKVVRALGSGGLRGLGG